MQVERSRQSLLDVEVGFIPLIIRTSSRADLEIFTVIILPRSWCGPYG